MGMMSGISRGKNVAVELNNGFFYKGVVIEVEDEYLRIKDVKGNSISLGSAAILTVRELDKNTKDEI